ncbi:MAG: AraC family transcriptional regulator ligand-binding domain-containing protein [Myxococcota bacterium]|nr:AraC family transcriptional regulator ligand-binding domain-containing protein [Myxococcota bacterium]
MNQHHPRAHHPRLSTHLTPAGEGEVIATTATPTPLPEAPLDPWLSGPPELSARLLRPLLRFYESRWGRAALERFVAGLGTNLTVLEDKSRWFSAEQFMAFNRAMVEETDDPKITYKAGRAFVEPSILGLEGYLMRALMTPRSVYKQAAVITSRYSRVTDWRFDLHGESRATVTFKPTECCKDDKNFCLNRLGSLEAIPVAFGLPAAVVDHPTCIHHGGERCVYRISWTRPSRWERPFFYGTLIALIGAGLSPFFAPVLIAPLLLSAAIAGLFTGALRLNTSRRLLSEAQQLWGQERTSLQRQIEVQRAESEAQQLSLRWQQALIKGSLEIVETERLIDSFLAELIRAKRCDRALFFRLEDGGKRACLARSAGYSAAHAQYLATLDLFLESAGDEVSLLRRITQSTEPLLIEDLEHRQNGEKRARQELLLQLGARSLVAVTIQDSNGPIGLILIDRVQSGAPLGALERDALAALKPLLQLVLTPRFRAAPSPSPARTLSPIPARVTL